MEYNGQYLDEQELPHLDQDHNSGPVDQQQYINEERINGGGNSPVDSRQVVDEEELLAAQAAADAAVAQQQQHGIPGGVFANVAQGLVGKNRDMMMQYWQETINSIEHDDHDFKNHQLPLARIKKVMKTDEDVKMISAEAPILFAKGCDVFITELSMRAWIHAEENKRRTLQKSDIAAALTKSDMFDFLIDVVPREEEKPKKLYTQHRSSYVHSPLQLNMLNQPHMQHMRVPPPPPAAPSPAQQGVSNELQHTHDSVGSSVHASSIGVEDKRPDGSIGAIGSIGPIDNNPDVHLLASLAGMATTQSPDEQALPHPQSHLEHELRDDVKPELYDNYSHYGGNY